jgi:excinuclease ABC subunit B
MTESMRRAIEETERRRNKQMAFNSEKGITPKGVFKKIRDLIDGVVDPQASEALLANAAAASDLASAGERSPTDLARELTRLEKAMHEHARNLEFEKAAQLRDQLARLKEEVFGVDKLQDSIEKAFV